MNSGTERLQEHGGILTLTTEGDHSALVKADLLATTAAWQHVRLKRPGEHAARLSLRIPSAVPDAPDGHIPIVGIVDECEPGLSPRLSMDGRRTHPLLAGPMPSRLPGLDS